MPPDRSTSTTSSVNSRPPSCPALVGDHPSPLRFSLARGLFPGTLNSPRCRSSTGFTLRNSGELQAATLDYRMHRLSRHPKPRHEVFQDQEANPAIAQEAAEVVEQIGPRTPSP